MFRSVLLSLLLLPQLSNYKLTAQVTAVVDKVQNHVLCDRLELFENSVLAYSSFKCAMIVNDSIAFLDPICVDQDRIYGGRGIDSCFYYCADSDTSLKRFNQNTSSWTRFTDIFAFKPVAHQGSEYFIERVSNTLGSFSWRLCQIVNDTIQKGLTNLVPGFEPRSWQRQIQSRDNFRRGGLFSSGTKLFISLTDTSGSQLFVGEVRNINQVDSLCQITLPNGVDFPVLETKFSVGDSILTYQIKDTYGISSLNHNFRRTASINLNRCQYSVEQFHAHHVLQAFGENNQYYIRDGEYPRRAYFGHKSIDSIVNMASLAAPLSSFRDFYVFGADDSNRLYFAPVSQKFEIWRTTGSFTERFYYDSLNTNSPSLEYGATAFNDSLFALLANRSGKKELFVFKQGNSKYSKIEIDSSLNIKSSWHQPLMQFDPKTPRIFFVAGGYSVPGSLGYLFYAPIPSFQNTAGTSSIKNIDLRVFPNPSEKVINIKSSMYLNQVLIRDLSGKVILKERDLRTKSRRIDLSNYTPGAYMVEVVSGQSNYFRKLIVK